MEAELQVALRRHGTLYKSLDPALLAQLAATAQRNGLDAKQGAAAFGKFMTVTRGLDATAVTAADVQAFGTSEHARGKSRAPLSAGRFSNHFSRPSLEDMLLGDSANDGLENAGMAAAAPASGSAPPASQRITPYMQRVAPQRSHTPTPGGKFAERQNAGSVVASLNAHLQVPAAGAAEEDKEGEATAMEVDGGAAPRQQQAGAAAAGAAARQQGQAGRCVVEVLGRPMGPGDKLMVDRLEDKVSYLERRIVAAEEAATSALGCEVHPVAAAAQDPALFVGRVVCDAEGGRLNPQSVLLEGSQRSSNGARVRLDVTRLPAFRLFPGQVLALRGTNPGGHCIVAGQLLPGLAAPLPRTPLPDLAAFAGATGPAGLSIVAAAGPFTSSEDLEYAPLGALLDYCSQPGQGQAPPDVLLLAGPFVDAEHPLVKGGLVEESFEELLASRVLGQIRRFVSSTGGRTRVLLLPSTRDVTAPPVLPQAPLASPLPGAMPPGTLPVANPSTLKLNEVVLGCTSADWLMACNREETAAAAAGEERLPALAAHLPAQRSYFPLFPPPLDCPVDTVRAVTALAMPATPDLLVLPSDLAPFAKLSPVHLPGEAVPAGPEGEPGVPAVAPAKDAGSTVCVNPGRLTKGASGGTFAHITILPLPEALAVAGGAPPPTNAPVPHQLSQRCRVEIKRV